MARPHTLDDESYRGRLLYLDLLYLAPPPICTVVPYLFVLCSCRHRGGICRRLYCKFAFGVECMELRADAAASVRPDLPSVQYTLVFPFRAFAALVPPAQEKENLLKKAHLV